MSQIYVNLYLDICKNSDLTQLPEAATLWKDCWVSMKAYCEKIQIGVYNEDLQWKTP